ncbi:prepilin-type N-terminal cleavage/methylation domain-containing protein [Verrucomicrobiota bacterium sgz303538]
MRNPTHKAAHLRARQGFTLLELVVVVAVLVILAGFILPKFDVFKLKANKGVAAANMSGISRLIQQYYVQNAVYPDRWDSLLSGGNLWAPGAPGGTAGLDPQLVGPDPTPTKLKTDTLTAGEVRSLTRIGIANVLDLDATSDELPNDRFITTRAISTTGNVAVINAPIATAAAPNPTGGDDDARNIVSHIYPGSNGVIPEGKKLVVFGLGSRNSMAGTLMQEVPFYSNTDVTQYYSRYLAVFAVSDSGSRAELKAVIGSDGDLIKEEIADYYER